MTRSRDWDGYWLARAHLNATMSTCSTRQVGAVAVRDRRSFADAFNGNIPGAIHCDEGGCARCAGGTPSGLELESCVCVHAEAALVAFCAREGIRLNGATVYATHHPCNECAKLLISAGVLEIVYDQDYPHSVLPIRPLYVTYREFSRG